MCTKCWGMIFSGLLFSGCDFLPFMVWYTIIVIMNCTLYFIHFIYLVYMFRWVIVHCHMDWNIVVCLPLNPYGSIKNCIHVTRHELAPNLFLHQTSRLNFYFKKFQKTGQFEDKRSVRPKETNVCTEDVRERYNTVYSPVKRGLELHFSHGCWGSCWKACFWQQLHFPA